MVLTKGLKDPGATIMKTLTSKKIEHMAMGAKREPTGRGEARTRKTRKTQVQKTDQLAKGKV